MILAGIILAEAATLYDNKNAIQVQSYGPESRGGASKAEVIISDLEIDHPEVINADILVALSQQACDKYFPNLKKEGTLFVDQEAVSRLPTNKAISLPFTRLASEASGKTITANMVALGALVAATSVVSREALEQAVLGRIPKGTEKINLDALHKGYEVIDELKKLTTIY